MGKQGSQPTHRPRGERGTTCVELRKHSTLLNCDMTTAPLNNNNPMNSLPVPLLSFDNGRRHMHEDERRVTSDE